MLARMRFGTWLQLGQRDCAATLALLACLAACTQTTPLSRTPDMRDRVLPTAQRVSPAQADASWREAETVFQRRCVVCHGCYDAPCQLKLDAYSGAARGASTERVYEPARLLAARPTRLDIDAHLTSEWRALKFHPVLPEAPNADATRSVLWRMLDLKRAHPLTPEVDIERTFTLDLDRQETCVKADAFDAYASDHPQWGMPYALPGISVAEQLAIEKWLAQGAPAPGVAPLPKALHESIADWEAYLNEPTPKRRLIARYVYEHLFLASLYFKDTDDTHFFRLVRSRSPHGFPVDEIATRRPFENPGDAQFFYRFVRRDGARLNKTHMPYPLGPQRLARYRELFDAPDYPVTEQPSYDLHVSSNPFRSFKQLPKSARYRFLLDDAEFFMMGFIKGPVCRGQVALNVIQERFWISFLDPDSRFSTELAEQLTDLQTQFEMPAQAGSNTLPLHWFKEAEQHSHYVQARNALWEKAHAEGIKLDLRQIWDGGGQNSHAALTVFRHFDSATVVRGFVGGPPKTAWVVDYPMFERIHYLLVAGFDVFGNVGHQIMTRLYMDFLRMEGEANYLAFVPSKRRVELTQDWYQDLPQDALQRVLAELAGSKLEPDIKYRSQDPELELDARLEQQLRPVLDRTYPALDATAPGHELSALAQLRGTPATSLPELSFLELETDATTGKAVYFTILRDSAHSNVAHLFNEDQRRVESNDRLNVVPGFLGAYPNALFHVRAGELGNFVAQLSALHNAADYRALRTRFGVLRSSPDFWTISDRIHIAARAAQPLTSGLFDYNRLQAQ